MERRCWRNVDTLLVSDLPGEARVESAWEAF
jgi:hypothetical protein